MGVVFCNSAKLVATVVTYPYIMAKTRLQMKGSANKYSGITDVLTQIVKTEGITGWYAGMGAQLFKSVLGTALVCGGVCVCVCLRALCFIGL